MLLRFVVGTHRENPYYLTGVLVSARSLRDDGRIGADAAGQLSELFDWFNVHLPCPPFRRNRRLWSEDAVCWFKNSAGEPLRRMWDLVGLLKTEGIPVRIVTTMWPGRVVYEDEHQVVAETPPVEVQDSRLVPRRGGRRLR